jgi:hypothetical protein
LRLNGDVAVGGPFGGEIAQPLFFGFVPHPDHDGIRIYYCEQISLWIQQQVTGLQ